MNTVLCLVLVSVAMVWGRTSFVSVPEEQLPTLLNMSVECMTKTGIQPDAMQQILAWHFEDTEIVRNFIYCFAYSTGYGDESGHLVKDKMMKLVANHKKRNEFGNVIDECNKSKGSNKYETMFKTSMCFKQKSPILFKL